MPAPADPLLSAVIQPIVQLGGVALDVQYAAWCRAPSALSDQCHGAAIGAARFVHTAGHRAGGSSTSLDVRV